VWIAEVISMLFGLTLIWMVAHIVQSHPGKNVGEILEVLVGKWLARVVMLILVLFAFTLGALVINNVASFMNTMLMQETPQWLFMVTIALATGYVLKMGVEILGRIVEMTVPIIVAVLLLLSCTLVLTIFKLENLQPMFTHDIIDIAKSVITISSFPYVEIILLLFIAVSTQQRAKLFQSTTIGLLVAGLLLVTRPLLVIGVFGVQEAARLTYPSFMLVREIQVGNFFERIELSIVMAWFFTSFIKLSICIYAVVQGLTYLLHLKDVEGKRLFFPISIAMVPLAMNAYANFQETQIFIRVGWPLTVLPLVGLFLILFLLNLVKREPS
jgi:spore germination protein KB